MRAIFSMVGLLLVVAIVGFLAKSQFGSGSKSLAAPVNDASITLPLTTPGATAQQQSQEIQTQIKQSVDAAMQQARPMPDDK